MRLTISNIDRKTSRGEPPRGGRPLITFALNLHFGDRVLFTSRGWMLGADWTVSPPTPYGFGGRKLVIFEVEGEFGRSLMAELRKSAAVRAHLGTVQTEVLVETAVDDLGERVEVPV